MTFPAGPAPELVCIKDHRFPGAQLSVLVRVRNEMKALPRFWASLMQQTFASQCEWIFLDSGSTDGSREFLLSLPARVYSLEGETFSFGRSCNQLMELATAPMACFLSAHVFLPQQDALEQAVKVVGAKPFAAAYLRQIPNPLLGSSVDERAQLVRRYPVLDPIVPLDRPEGFSNAASILTRDSWQRIPFPQIDGSEDFAWAQQHLARGGALYYLSSILAEHSHNETPAQLHQRVALNVRARGGVRSFWRGNLYLLGVFVALLRAGATVREAWSYASAHARAYWTGGRQ